MKRKIFIILFLYAFTVTNVNASRFKFVFSKNVLPAYSEQAEEADDIYCDTKNHWCSYAAERLYKQNIYTGMRIGEKYYFMPDEYITRGEFLLYIDAVLDIPATNDQSLPFADKGLIPSWQLPTVCSMFSLGYIHGNVEKGMLFFNHDEKISRLECAIILSNILNIKNTGGTVGYYDSYLIPKYATNAVKNVTDYKIMQGYEDNSFRPYVKVTRAMLADILCSLTMLI